MLETLTVIDQPNKFGYTISNVEGMMKLLVAAASGTWACMTGTSNPSNTPGMGHEAWRGRRHAFESLNPTTTALVVVDMVPFFVAHSASARGIVPDIQLLGTALRSAGGTIGWVLPSTAELPPASTEFFGTRPSLSRTAARVGRGCCAIDCGTSSTYTQATSWSRSRRPAPSFPADVICTSSSNNPASTQCWLPARWRTCAVSRPLATPVPRATG